jgi:hypothetical protein
MPSVKVRIANWRKNMCVIVVVRGKECDTKAQLRDALGIEPIKSSIHKIFDDGDCLCPCDLEATAKKADMRLSGDSWDMQTMTPNVERSDEHD